MTGRNRIAILLAGAAVPALAIASETITYRYDAQGRLVKVERSGSVNNGAMTSYAFDKADNRISKTESGGTPPPPPPSSPPPSSPPPSSPPPPGNQPPVTAADYLTVAPCGSGTIEVTANDSDPEGDRVWLVWAGAASLGTATKVSARHIAYTSNGTPGSDSIAYTIEDDLGAQAGGTLHVTITGGTCP